MFGVKAPLFFDISMMKSEGKSADHREFGNVNQERMGKMLVN